MNTARTNCIWTGTAEVTPKDGNFLIGEARGAYVAVVGVAPNSKIFVQRVKRCMNALDFNLIDLDDIQQVRGEFAKSSFDPELSVRLDTLNEENPVEIGSFHVFSSLQ